MRQETILSEITSEILKNEYGKPGSKFITARELSKKYMCSLHCALDVIHVLRDRSLLRSSGKKYFLTHGGRCGQETPFIECVGEKVNNLLGVIIDDSHNLFLGSLINYLSDVAFENGYSLIISNSCGNQNTERKILDNFVALGCKGIFNCIPIIKYNIDYFSRYPLPVVTIAENAELPNIDVVLVNNINAGEQVAGYLYKCGCRNFAYITSKDYFESDLRLAGFQTGLALNGFELSEDKIGVIPDKLNEDAPAHIRKFVSQLLSESLNDFKNKIPLGIFCVNDLIAIDVVRIVKHFYAERFDRFAIPNEVMVVGFDDLSIATISNPTLTTVTYKYSLLAQKAFRVMQDYITNSDHKPGIHMINSSLVLRESTRII